jgi:hypothetical protein
LYFESLTSEHKDELIRRWYAIDYDTRKRVYALALNATIEVIGEDNCRAVYTVTAYLPITSELIALHKLEKPFFLPLVVPEFDHKQN